MFLWRNMNRLGLAHVLAMAAAKSARTPTASPAEATIAPKRRLSLGLGAGSGLLPASGTPIEIAPTTKISE